MSRAQRPFTHAARRRESVGHSGPTGSTAEPGGVVSPVPFFLLLFALLFLPAPDATAKGAGPRLPHPGFRSIGLWNPDIPIRMDLAVWYPSPRIPRDLLLDGWSILVGQNGITIPGKYPVILISHTMAASRLASHDLAAVLARHGFVVIAPTHPRDNMDDTSGIFHAALFADRPRQLMLALETAAKNAVLRNIMDRSRIGVLGVGAGAATALQLAGAMPDLSLLDRHCGPENEHSADPLCSSWARLFHPAIQEEFTALLAEGPEKFTPGFVAKTDTPQALPVLAIGLLTPGLIGLFPDAALQGVAAPVGILAVADDTVYPTGKSVDRLLRLLPQRPASRVLQHAGHFDLQAPCPPMYRESFAALCGSLNPAAEDWRKIRNDFFVRFFQKNLGSPIPQ